MPIVKSLAEVQAGAMQRIDKRGFHKARFIDRTAWCVIRTRGPFHHPVKDFKLAELRLPARDTLGAEIVYKGLLTRASSHCEQGTQLFIKQIPLLLETIESTLRLLS